MDLRVQSLQQATAEAEATPVTSEEQKWCQLALAAVDDAQRDRFASIPLDVLCVVRGFAHEKDRTTETRKAMAKISEWRAQVDYYRLFDEMHPKTKDFHDWWPEHIYGVDDWGHMLHATRMFEMDHHALARLDDITLDKLQAQKMKAYATYTQDLSLSTGRQRYKHIMIVDLTGVSMSMLMGEKKRLIQRVFSLGSSYFPESMWQIYCINSPAVFRAIWAIIKQFLHPVTVNKVQIIGSYKEALKTMTAQHIPMESLPVWMGGHHPGKRTFDYIQELVSVKRQHGSSPL